MVGALPQSAKFPDFVYADALSSSSYLTYAWDAEFVGTDHLLVAASGSHDGVTALDVANLAVISYDGDYTNANLNGVAYLTVDGNYAYVSARDGDSCFVLDISALPTITLEDSLVSAGLSDGHEIVKVGDYCFIACGNDDRVASVDVSTPSNISLADTYYSMTYLDGCENIVASPSGNYLYCGAAHVNRLTVLDISTPTAIAYETSIQDATYLSGVLGVTVGGGHLFVASDGYLAAYDITSEASPSFVSRLALSGFVSRALIYDEGYLYAADDGAGAIEIIDVRTPSSMSVYDTLTHANLSDSQGLALRGSYKTGDAVLAATDHAGTGNVCLFKLSGT